jgi:hypothetical protein
MARILLFFVSAFVLSFSVSAQIVFPADKLHELNSRAVHQPQSLYSDNLFSKEDNFPSTNLMDFFQRQEEALNLNIHAIMNNPSKSNDTMFVGITPGDSVYITGNFFNDGPIVVFGDGVLVFENADAHINGDIYVWGSEARIEILNSIMNFPQYYIYQRRMVAVAGGLIEIRHSTLNYSGLQHDLVITDSSKVIWQDVEKIGFTTCGISSVAQLEVDSASQAEFILLDHASLSFENASFILLWHHIPDTSSLSASFPDGTMISTFDFSDVLPGVNNLFYSYSLDNCSDIMWGLMPEPGSQTVISDSQIRTIGVWFKNQPAYEVSGLVNNSYYSNFMAPLSDHSLQLINTNVQTWSLYLFSNAHGTIENCIVGEIGLFNNSSATVSNTMVDGSGGYMFGGDTSMTVFGYGYLNSDFHTNGHAIGILAYAGQNWGRCIAKDKSIMIVIQSNLPQEPEFLHDAAVWYGKIDGSSTVYADSILPVHGSAWLDRASDYYSLDLAWYQLDYAASGTENWLSVCPPVYDQEVYNDVLSEWNTNGLQPGTYMLKLTMCDNTVDSNVVELVKQFVMLPSVAAIEESGLSDSYFVYPNPSDGIFHLEIREDNNAIERIHVINSQGVQVETIELQTGDRGCDNISIDLKGKPSGVYFLIPEGNKGIFAVCKIQLTE